MRIPSTTILHGLIGGLLAGAVVALWFLALDLAAGVPLATPRLLAGELLGGQGEVPGARLVLAYSFLHFGVFAALGIGTALFLHLAGVRPGLLVGLIVGLGVLDAVHYGALLVAGPELTGALPGAHVLLANLAAGVALVAYLHQATHERAPLGLATLREYPLLVRGIVTGVVGGLAVAVWFLALDSFAGRPLFTPAALGSLVFLGAAGPAEVRITLGTVAAYTLLHFAVFAAAGIALVWAAEQLERQPTFWLMAFMALVVLEGVFLAATAGSGVWILGTLTWWAVGVGNLIAVAAMLGWIWKTHPVLRRELAGVPAETRL
ncbi:MAG: hypothetical protein ACRELV_00590 [Longimicrobiales bacterium]